MPEGHTIHRLASAHRRDLAGEVVHLSSPQGRFTDASTLGDAIRVWMLGTRTMYACETCQRR